MNLIKSLLSPIHQLRARMSYDRAVRLAEQNLAATGQRTYVIAGYPHQKKNKRHLIITDRKHFRRMKLSGYINKSATIKDMEYYCYYCTSYQNGSNALPPETVASKRKDCINFLING